MNIVQQIYSASKQVFGKRKYIAIFLAFSVLFFWLFVYIPVAATPGNTFTF